MAVDIETAMVWKEVVVDLLFTLVKFVKWRVTRIRKLVADGHSVFITCLCMSVF
jgi:hypothetical protein